MDIKEAKIGDEIHTFDILGNPYSFLIHKIENKTEGGSTKWGRVFYDIGNNFMTEKAISGIFSDSEPIERTYTITRGDLNGNS